MLVSPPPVIPASWTYPDKDEARTRKYAEECSLVAQRYNLFPICLVMSQCLARLKIKFIDLFTTLNSLTRLEQALSDGLHLARFDSE